MSIQTIKEDRRVVKRQQFIRFIIIGHVEKKKISVSH